MEENIYSIHLCHPKDLVTASDSFTMSTRGNIRKWSSVDVGQRDVLLGRSRKSYSHSGNVVFRELVSKHVDRYQKKTSRTAKAALLTELVCRVHETGGRFLRYDGDTWTEVPEKTAKEKVSHALRDARLALVRESSSGGLPSSGLNSFAKGAKSQITTGAPRSYQVAAADQIKSSPLRRLPIARPRGVPVPDPQLMVSNPGSALHILRGNPNFGNGAAPCSPHLAMNAPTTEEQALDYQIQNLIRLRNSIQENHLLNEARQNNVSYTMPPQSFSAPHPPPRLSPGIVVSHEQEPLPLPPTRTIPQQEQHVSPSVEVVVAPSTPPPECVNRHRQSTIEQVWFGPLPEVSDDEVFHEKEDSFYSENSQDVKCTIKALERALDICGDDFDSHGNDAFYDDRASRCLFQDP